MLNVLNVISVKENFIDHELPLEFPNLGATCKTGNKILVNTYEVYFSLRETSFLTEIYGAGLPGWLSGDFIT